MKTLKTKWLLAAMLLMAFTFAACGSDDDDETPVTDPLAGLQQLLPTEDGMYHDNTLLYRITNEQNREVEVVNPVFPETFKGTEIPKAVNIDGKRYAVTAIADNAFGLYIDEIWYSNDVLEYLILPSSLKRIGEHSCFFCVKLKSITIPKGVEKIGQGSFERCFNLETIAVETGNAVYDSRQNCNALIETKSNTLIRGCQNTIIPDGIKTIGNAAFLRVENLKDVKIPTSVTSIDSWAFYYCTGITNIELPSSVTNLGGMAFGDCVNLKKITCLNTTPPTLGNNVFSGIDTECILYVPDRSVDKYLSQWPFKSGYVKAIGTSPNR